MSMCQANWNLRRHHLTEKVVPTACVSFNVVVLRLKFLILEFCKKRCAKLNMNLFLQIHDNNYAKPETRRDFQRTGVHRKSSRCVPFEAEHPDGYQNHFVNP